MAGQGRGRGRGTTVATGRGTTMAQMNGLPSQPLGMGVAYQNGHVPDAASMVHSGPQSTVRSENQSSSPVFSVGIGRGSRATNGKLPKCTVTGDMHSICVTNCLVGKVNFSGLIVM